MSRRRGLFTVLLLALGVAGLLLLAPAVLLDGTQAGRARRPGAGLDAPRAGAPTSPTATRAEEAGVAAPASASATTTAEVASAARTIAGRLTRDRQPWPGGRLLCERPDGPPVVVVAGPDGRFAVALARAWWRLAPDPSWPAGWCVAADLVGAGEVGAGERPALDRAFFLRIGGHEAPRFDLADGTHLGEPEPDEALRVDAVPPLSVHGRVVDDADRPVAGARVDLRDAAGDTPVATSAADGSFGMLLEAWRIGAKLVAEAPGRAPGASALLDWRADWTPGEPLPPVTIRLGHALLPLAGRVVDLDGRPVAASVVVLAGLADPTDPPQTVDWWREAACDPDGRFRLEVPAGVGGVGPWCARVELTIERAGFAAARLEVVAARGAPPVEVTLLRLGRLAGVVRGPDGAPCAGASLSAWSWPVVGHDSRATTGADGRFSLEAPEQALLLVTGPADALQRRLVLRLPAPDLDLRLERSATIGGVIRTDRGGPAPSSLVVRPADRPAPDEAPPLRPGDRHELPMGARGHTRVHADGQGRFRAWGFAPGQRVEVAHDAGWEQVVIAPAEVVVTLPPPPRAWGQRLRVRAVAAESGAPLEAQARAGGSAAALALDGGWLDVRDAGDVEVTVEAPGRVPATRVVRVEAGQVVDAGDVALAAAGALDVAVRWPDQPITSLEARWADPDGRPREAWRESPPRPADGWTIDGLAPGRATVVFRLHLGDGTTRDLPPRDVQVRAGAATAVELDLRGVPR